MSEFIKELTQEAHEIITNAHAAEHSGEITQEQRIEVIQNLLSDIADRLGLAGDPAEG
jgi:hypothetical protein